MIFTVKGGGRFEILFKVHEELRFEYLGSVNLSGVTLQEYRFSVLYMGDLYSSRYFSRYIFFFTPLKGQGLGLGLVRLLILLTCLRLSAPSRD